MTLQEQANILAAALAGKDILVQKRIGGPPWRTASSPDYTRFNFQDYIYEVADMEPKPLSIEAQARILGAASLGEPLEATNFPICDDSIWRQVTLPHTFDFTKIAYRVAEERPKTRVLHQYIILTRAGQRKMTQFFYTSPEEALKHCMSVTSATSATPVPWTRIEVPE